MTALKVAQIGNSLGVILPRELLAKLRVGKGDALFVTDTPDGLLLSPYDPGLAEQVDALRDVMKSRRGALRALAR